MICDSEPEALLYKNVNTDTHMIFRLPPASHESYCYIKQVRCRRPVRTALCLFVYIIQCTSTNINMAILLDILLLSTSTY